MGAGRAYRILGLRAGGAEEEAEDEEDEAGVARSMSGGAGDGGGRRREKRGEKASAMGERQAREKSGSEQGVLRRAGESERAGRWLAGRRC